MENKSRYGTLMLLIRLKRSIRILGYPNLFKDCEIESFEV
jgi:hypothetical protein